MASIRTVNLLWQRRIRGTYPVARQALDDTGTLTLAVPRPLETRTYDLSRVRIDGGVEVSGSFAVETLLELEVTADADSFLGMTADDVYIFHAGSKNRFLGEKRIYFTDTALSRDGQSLTVGFSDMAGASFALALGTMTGQVLWTRDMDASPAAVVMSDNGGWLAVGGENGTLRLLDRHQREQWEFVQEEPVRALACTADGLTVAYGTSAGSVGLIDGTGARRWETRLLGEIIALALSADGSRCAVLSRAYGDNDGTSLTCLIGQGQIGWEFHIEKQLSGLSLSPNGRYLATGAKDGSAAVYEIIPGETTGAAVSGVDSLATVRSRYAELRETAPEEAYRLLRDALQSCPADADFAAEVVAARQSWLDSRLARAREARETRDYLAALDTLEKVLAVEPREPQATMLLAEVLAERARQLVAEAIRMQNAGNAVTAEEVLLEAIAADPFCLEARQSLSELRARRCADADAEADRLLAQGELHAGVAALEQAQAAAPTAERAAKLERAQIAMEFGAGMAAYNGRNYHQAIFQFKKVLARDAAHAEARRYLGFAESFAQDVSTESLSDRFSKLEPLQ